MAITADHRFGLDPSHSVMILKGGRCLCSTIGTASSDWLEPVVPAISLPPTTVVDATVDAASVPGTGGVAAMWAARFSWSLVEFRR